VRILVDLTHPAHVHFFSLAIGVWRERGHQVLLTARDKDLTLDLLDEAGLSYHLLSRARRGVTGLALELMEREVRLLGLIRRFRPQVMTAVGGTFIVHPARLLGIPSVVFYDTENARLSNAITYPFATCTCTPDCYQGDLGRKQERYPGYHELAYLHPDRFRPDPAVLDQAGLKEGQPFSLVRFVAWASSHDLKQTGFSRPGKAALVKRLAGFGRVLISSEAPLPPELESYRLRLSPGKVHSLLKFARLLVGESATMASEAAVLGTPAVFMSPVGRGYTDELEREYGLCFTLHREGEVLDKVAELLARPDLRADWAAKRDRLLREKIDVTEWLVRRVERAAKPGPARG